MEAKSGTSVVSSESRADVAQKDEPADGENVKTRVSACGVDSRLGDGVADGVADQIEGRAQWSGRSIAHVAQDARAWLQERGLSFEEYKRRLDATGCCLEGRRCGRRALRGPRRGPGLGCSLGPMWVGRAAAKLLLFRRRWHRWGASERASEPRMSGRKADDVRYDWNGQG